MSISGKTLNDYFGEFEDMSFEKLLETLNKYDTKDYFSSKENISNRNFQKDFNDELKFPKYKNRAVLGMDILGYSQMDSDKQDLIPFLFYLLLNYTYESLISSEKFLFSIYQNNEKTLQKGFISTGDGGFQILPNPLYALVFAIHFQSTLQFFQSGRYHAAFSKYFKGDIKIRYALSYDKLFRFNSNFYGKAIIHSARIMSKDKLDRFLMDYKSYRWFQEEFNGIETLELMDMNMLKSSPSFADFDYSYYSRDKDMVIGDVNNNDGIQNLIVQEIGKLQVKNDSLRVFNLFCQFSFEHQPAEDIKDCFVNNKVRMSLGNLNPMGLVD